MYRCNIFTDGIESKSLKLVSQVNEGMFNLLLINNYNVFTIILQIKVVE